MCSITVHFYSSLVCFFPTTFLEIAVCICKVESALSLTESATFFSVGVCPSFYQSV